MRRLMVAGLGPLLVVTGWTAIADGADAASPHTWTVDALGDGLDASPGDGACRTAAGHCSLRAAIQEANASSGPDVITLPAGRIELSQPNRFPVPSQTADLELDPTSGDIDLLLGPIAISGAGAARTTIDGNGIDRVFSVAPTASLSVRDLTITGGDATANDKTEADISIGGAILNQGGQLTAERVALVDNKADGGGGIFSIPFTTFTLRDSLVARNAAVEGGGLRIDGGATIINTTITGNSLFHRLAGDYIPDEITGYGGGIDHRGSGNVTIVNSTITNNQALKAGGGYSSGQGYTPISLLTQQWPYKTYLANTVIAGNTTAGKPDNCHVSSMVIVSQGHNLASDATCFLTAAGDRPGSDPLLGGLADNGGPTASQLPAAGSPLIDAAASAGCPSADQRGVPRPYGTACDIGAVEWTPAGAHPVSRKHCAKHRGKHRRAPLCHRHRRHR